MDLTPLKNWINTNSGSLNPAGLRQMADHLAAELVQLPGRLERIPSAPYKDLDGTTVHPGDSLYFHFNESASRHVLLSGHMDTVFGPEHTFQFWSEDDTCLYGPGVADMKGGLFILMMAAKEFIASGPKHIGLKILINGDEEIGSPGSSDLLKQAAESCQVGLVFESSLPDGALVHQRKGTATIRLNSHGQAAHTGRDFESGRNALVAMADLVAECHKLNEQFPGVLLNVGSFNSNGPVNVVPDWAEAWINIRTDEADTILQLNDAIEQIIKDVSRRHRDIVFEKETGAVRFAKQETATEKKLHQLWNTAERALGYDPVGKRATGGTSDGNIFAEAGLPHLDGVGVRGGHLHSEKEFCFKESIPDQISKTVAFLELLDREPSSIL